MAAAPVVTQTVEQDSWVNSLANFGQGIAAGITALGNATGAVAQSVVNVRNTINSLQGKSTEQTANAKATEGMLLNPNVVSPQLQNLLVLGGIIMAGVGLAFALRK